MIRAQRNKRSGQICLVVTQDTTTTNKCNLCLCGCGTSVSKSWVHGHNLLKDGKYVPTGRFVTCSCGCGEMIPEKNKRGEFATFKHNHHMKGARNNRYNNGRTKTRWGYIRINMPSHHRADSNGFTFEHIVIYEQTHNCSILKWGAVHHINGIKDDNRPENLAAMMHGHHATHHLHERWKNGG